MGFFSLIVFKCWGRVGSSLLWNLDLGQFLAVRLDKGGKSKGVVARAFLGEFGVALFQRLDDRKMLRQRRRDALGAADGELAIAAHMQEDFVGHIDQYRRFRQ